VATQAELEAESAALQAKLDAQAKAQAKTSSLGIGDLFDTISKGFSLLFSWGLPLAIFGSIFLAASGPIGELVEMMHEPWKKPFDKLTGSLKMMLKGYGIDIFSLSDDERAGMLTPENVQAKLAESVSAEIAEAIAPNQAAVNDLDKFAKKDAKLPEGLLSADAAKTLLKPKILARFIETHPQTMQRVITALPVGKGAASIPANIKAPLKLLFADKARAKALLNISAHKDWVVAAAEKLAGTSAGALVREFNNDQNIKLFNIALDGGDINAEIQKMKDAGELSVGAVQTLDAATQQAKEEIYAALEKGPLGAAIKAIADADSNFKDELLDFEKTPGKAEILALVLKSEDRILVLKGLDDKAFTTLATVLGFANEAKSLGILKDSDLRATVLDNIATLASTNASGKNELSDMITALQQPGASMPTILAGYLGNNQTRQKAIAAIQTALFSQPQQASTRSIVVNKNNQQVQANRNTLAAGLNVVIENAPIINIVAQASKTLPKDLSYLLTQMQNPQALAMILSDEAWRDYLTKKETNGVTNIYVFGDALKQIKEGLVKENDPKYESFLTALTLLTTQDTAGRYPNLDAVMVAIETMDNATGSNLIIIAGTPNKDAKGKTRTKEEEALYKKTMSTEHQADEENMGVLAFLMELAGGDISAGTKNDAAEKTTYKAQTILGEQEFSAERLAGYFNDPVIRSDEDGQLVATSRQTVAAVVKLLKDIDVTHLDKSTQNVVDTLNKNFWNDANDNGIVDLGEGLATILKDPKALAKILATKTGDNQIGFISTAIDTTFAMLGIGGSVAIHNNSDGLNALKKATKAPFNCDSLPDGIREDIASAMGCGEDQSNLAGLPNANKNSAQRGS
jgi:hypothetical protein